MLQKLRPVRQSLIDLFKRSRIICLQSYALPPLVGHVRALDGLDVEVKGACFGRGADGGIAAVGEGAGLTVAEAGHVMFVAAEGLVFCRFELVAAELSGVVSG